MSNEELLRFRPEDPISGHIQGDGFNITGGHHRLNEINRRVAAGELSADTKVRILFHDWQHARAGQCGHAPLQEI